MPTVRIGQPMTHLILSAAGPLPKEKKLPIRSWRASIYPGGVDPDGLNLDHVSWESGNQWHAPSRSHSPFPQHRDDALHICASGLNEPSQLRDLLLSPTSLPFSGDVFRPSVRRNDRHPNVHLRPNGRRNDLFRWSDHG